MLNVSGGHMETWRELNKLEHGDVWDRFEEAFAFVPSMQTFPGIAEPHPSMTYALRYPYQDDDVNELTEVAVESFRACLAADERMYALDWQHTCFWFSPHNLLPGQSTTENPIDAPAWRIPVFPNGDYSIFLAPDLAWGIFSHPWEMTVCIFGAPLLAAFGKRSPAMFERIIRQR